MDGGGRHGGVILPVSHNFFASEATINLTAFQVVAPWGSTVDGWLRSIRRPWNSRRLQTAVSPLAVELSLCSIHLSHCGVVVPGGMLRRSLHVAENVDRHFAQYFHPRIPDQMLGRNAQHIVPCCGHLISGLVLEPPVWLTLARQCYCYQLGRAPSISCSCTVRQSALTGDPRLELGVSTRLSLGAEAKQPSMPLRVGSL